MYCVKIEHLFVITEVNCERARQQFSDFLFVSHTFFFHIVFYPLPLFFGYYILRVHKNNTNNNGGTAWLNAL